jgi:uncharacterized membrane protein (DUF106 family)
MAFEYKYDAKTVSDEEKLEELKDYMKALEEVHRAESSKESSDTDKLTQLETELTAKRTEYENLGGTFD